MILIFVSAMLVFATAAPVSEDKDLALLFGNEEIARNEFGEHFEGDMVLTEEQKIAVAQATDARNGLRGGAKRWPNNTVVYHINEGDFEEEEIKKIQKALEHIASKSCINFRTREGDEHAVVIEGTGNGCYSSVGHTTVDDDGESLPQNNNTLGEERQLHTVEMLTARHTSAKNNYHGTNQAPSLSYKSLCMLALADSKAVAPWSLPTQSLNLQTPNCVKHGTIIHEMLHTLGFYHMQSTYDRDDFVKIEWENIKSGTEHNFAKYNNDTVTDFGVEYDYGSVMHYPELAFSKNGNKTIIPLKEGVKIGQREGMSESDILKLNKMYCEESTSPNDFFRE